MSNKNEKVFPASVVKLMDIRGFKIVINRGSEDGVKLGQRFMVYAMDEELFDPETFESLGVLEIAKGTGKVIHVQEKMATIESDNVKNERTIKKSNVNWTPNQEETIVPTNLPFDHPVIGDKAKPI